MLPSSLKGIYREYKADTDIVAEWLAVTAKARGYRDADSSSPSKPAAAGGRLKGKARKQAKEALSEQASTPGTKPKNTHIIKTKDYEPMAVYIAGCSGITIPRYFAMALDRVISVRKNFAERLASNGINIGVDSDDSHSYFVEVLEKVRQALQPLLATVQVSSVRKAPSTANKKSGKLFNNIFSTLEVYQTSKKFDNAPDAAPPPSSMAIKYVAEHGNSKMDLYFVLAALLDDYAKLRNEIGKLWTDHAAGRLDLTAVSVATNASFELARSMEDDVAPLLQKVGGTHLYVERVFLAVCRAAGIDPVANMEPGDIYNPEAYDFANACFFNTLCLVSSFTSNLSTDYKLARIYNGEHGWYDEALRGSAQTNHQKWKQDCTAVSELMPDLQFLAMRLDYLSVVDELTRGLMYMIMDRRENTPLWLAFAVQVYLDVLHTFGSTCDGLGTMQAESRRIKIQLLDVPASECGQVLRAAALWDIDPIWAMRKLAIEAHGLPYVLTPPFRFLQRNPIYCGLLIQNMQAVVQIAGLQYAATTGALVRVVQLYHALHHEGLLGEECRWEDLVTLWKLQGNASFFVGDLPTTKEAYFKNYCVSNGTSVAHWAAAQRRRKGSNRVKMQSGNRRNFMPMGYVSLLANHRLVHHGARVPWSCAVIEEMLNTGFAYRYRDSRSRLQPLSKPAIEQAKQRFAQLPPSGLIRELAEAIQHEKPGFYFNLFTMQNKAWLFLEALQRAVETILGGGAIRTAAANEPLVTCTPGLCIAVAAGKALDHSLLLKASDTLLRAAAEVLQTFVQGGHGSVVKDIAEKDIDSRDVENLHQGLDLWGFDDVEPSSEPLGPQRPGEASEEFEKLLQMF